MQLSSSLAPRCVGFLHSLHEILPPLALFFFREDSFLPHQGRFCPAAGSCKPSTPPQQFPRLPQPRLRSPPAAFPHGQGSPATLSTSSQGVCSPPPREQRPRLRWLFEGGFSFSTQAIPRPGFRTSSRLLRLSRPAPLPCRPLLSATLQPGWSRAAEPQRYRLHLPRVTSPRHREAPPSRQRQDT